MMPKRIEKVRATMMDYEFMESVKYWARGCEPAPRGCVPVRHDHLHRLAKEHMEMLKKVGSALEMLKVLRNEIQEIRGGD